MSTEPNIALGKDTVQSPGAYQYGTSNKAVDGKIENTGADSECAHTDWNTWDTEAWWRVDLGDTYKITGIKIYNRDRDGKLYLLTEMFYFGMFFTGST